MLTQIGIYTGTYPVSIVTMLGICGIGSPAVAHTQLQTTSEVCSLCVKRKKERNNGTNKQTKKGRSKIFPRSFFSTLRNIGKTVEVGVTMNIVKSLHLFIVIIVELLFVYIGGQFDLFHLYFKEH